MCTKVRGKHINHSRCARQDNGFSRQCHFDRTVHTHNKLCVCVIMNVCMYNACRPAYDYYGFSAACVSRYVGLVLDDMFIVMPPTPKCTDAECQMHTEHCALANCLNCCQHVAVLLLADKVDNAAR